MLIKAQHSVKNYEGKTEENYSGVYDFTQYKIIVHHIETTMGMFFMVEMIPNMCNQLHIHLTTVRGGRIDGKKFVPLAERTMENVRTFCSDIYNSEAMFGMKSYVKGDHMRRRLLRLHNGEGTCFYALDKNGCPKKVNARSFDWTAVRRQLTANADSKMSKKLWSATDWLFSL